MRPSSAVAPVHALHRAVAVVAHPGLSIPEVEAAAAVIVRAVDDVVDCLLVVPRNDPCGRVVAVSLPALEVRGEDREAVHDAREAARVHGLIRHARARERHAEVVALRALVVEARDGAAAAVAVAGAEGGVRRGVRDAARVGQRADVQQRAVARAVELVERARVGAVERARDGEGRDAGRARRKQNVAGPLRLDVSRPVRRRVRDQASGGARVLQVCRAGGGPAPRRGAAVESEARTRLERVARRLRGRDRRARRQRADVAARRDVAAGEAVRLRRRGGGGREQGRRRRGSEQKWAHCSGGTVGGIRLRQCSGARPAAWRPRARRAPRRLAGTS